MKKFIYRIVDRTLTKVERLVLKFTNDTHGPCDW